MRMMVTIRVPADAGSRAIKDGRMKSVIGSTIEKIKPEAVYFPIEQGCRTMRAYFDMKANSAQVHLFEPALMELSAEVELTPVMSPDELMAGFAQLG